MTDDEYHHRREEIEARANLAYGAALNRRTPSGGRYWALGQQIAAMALEPLRTDIETWMRDELETLERQYFAEGWE